MLCWHGLPDDQKRLIALQSSSGLVADFLQRYLNSHPGCKWDMLKQELSARFALVSDSIHALTLLGRIRQGRNENVQIFAERLLNLAQQAFQDQGGPVMEQQLIGFFIDGLVSNAIKMKILRESPNTFQEAIKIATAEQNLINRFQFELYKVLNLEMALNYTPRDMTAYIALQSQYLAITLEGTKYMLLEEENERQCSRPLLKFCEVSNPIYNVVSRQQCLVALFFNQTENIEKLCVKMINVNARLPLITEINPHLWAVTTKSPLRFSVVCYDRKAVTKEIIINPLWEFSI